MHNREHFFRIVLFDQDHLIIKVIVQVETGQFVHTVTQYIQDAVVAIKLAQVFTAAIGIKAF
jgi:hypothetical protein